MPFPTRSPSFLRYPQGWSESLVVAAGENTSEYTGFLWLLVGFIAIVTSDLAFEKYLLEYE